MTHAHRARARVHTDARCTTLVELLQRLSRVFKDYCGVLTEESVRRNFLLLYELLDEVLDRGCPQSMCVARCGACVRASPALARDARAHMRVPLVRTHAAHAHARTRLPADSSLAASNTKAYHARERALCSLMHTVHAIAGPPSC